MDSVRFRFDDIEVDPACFAVTRGGRPVALEPKAVTLLLHLLEHRSRVVSKDELVELLWKDTFVTPNALTRLVAQLRRELGDAAHEARYIQTAHRRGYRFIAPVTAVAAPPWAIAGSAGAAAPAAERPTASRHLPRLAAAAAGLVLLAALGAAALRNRLDVPLAVDVVVVPTPVQVTASLGLDADPALSRDGRLLAWSSDASGRSEIFVKEVDGGVERQVTRDGMQNVEPAWSPDGRWVAYRSRLRRGIWLVAASGGEPRQVAEFGARPTWSPDGRRIAFGSSSAVMAARTQVWSARRDGSDLRPLTTAGEPEGTHQMPQWSPDGSRLAFVAGGPGHTALWIQELASGRLTRVREEHVVTGLAFAPAGDALLWAEASRHSPGRVWYQPLDPAGRPRGEPAVLATTGAITPAAGLAAAGGRVAWVSTRVATNLWALPLGGGRPAGPPRPLTRTTYRNTFPVFSPDGSRIAFQLKRPGADSEVWTIAAGGGGATPALPGDSRGFFPAWMPGGDRVFAVENAGGGERFASLDVRAGRRDAIRAVNDERHPRLSPDGRSVAYHAPVDGTLQVFVAPVEGGPSRQVTFSPTDAAYPSWSPDGRRLAVEVRTGEDVHVAVVPATGGLIRHVTSGHGINWPHSWAPDNDRIAFAGERGGEWELYTVSSGTGEVRQLTSFGTPNGYVRYPAWSPNDTSVVFERAEPRGNIWVAPLPAPGDEHRDARAVVHVNRVEQRQR